jgi:hypothetical protein
MKTGKTHRNSVLNIYNQIIMTWISSSVFLKGNWKSNQLCYPFSFSPLSMKHSKLKCTNKKHQMVQQPRKCKLLTLQFMLSTTKNIRQWTTVYLQSNPLTRQHLNSNALCPLLTAKSPPYLMVLHWNIIAPVVLFYKGDGNFASFRTSRQQKTL